MADRRRGKRVAGPQSAPRSARGKKGAPVRDGRAVRRDSAAKAKPTSRKTASAATRAKSGARRGRSAGKTVAGKRGEPEAMPTRLMRIRALDPQAACGQGTTVMQLFRVDDLPFGNETTHLVFHDRHGWYCQHGRDCPAVAAVRRHEKHVTLTR